jgi:hypothetical protein
MDREYDIFEKLPDGTLMWRTVATGHDNAISVVKKLATDSPHEFQVIHLPTKAVIARINQKRDS